jgi:hypothetical protein
MQPGRKLRLLRGGNGSFDYSGNVSLTLGAHSFVPDIFSRVHIKQFVAIGAILTGAQGLFLHEAVCHESVIMLRGLLFGRTSLGNAMFQQKAKHGV